MKEIIEKLAINKADIDFDIQQGNLSEEDKNKYLRQSTQLAHAIGILSTLGSNNNIKE